MNGKVKTMTQMARSYVTKKVLLGTLALAMGIAMIAMYSFVPYSWKPEHILTNEFFTDTLIIVAITLLGMVCMIFIAQATNAINPASKISKASAEYKAVREKVSDRYAYKQWIKNVQQPSDLDEIKERVLNNVGVYDMSLLNLSAKQLKELVKGPQRYDGVFYSTITKRQAQTCIKVKSGLRVRFPVLETYLNAKALLDNRTRSERLANENSKTRNYALASILSKVVMVIVTSMVFTMLVRDLAGESDTAEAVGKFTVRMMNLMSSSFLGFFIGGQLNDIAAEYIDIRTGLIDEFLHDASFKPETIQETAKRQYLEAHPEESLDEGCQNPPMQI